MSLIETLTGGLFGGAPASSVLAAGLSAEPRAAFGPSDSVSNERGWFVQAFGGKTESGVEVSEWTAMNLPAVYSCVSIIVDNLAQLPIIVARKRPDGGREVLTDHPLTAILHDSPNPDMTSFVFRQSVSSHALLWGNGMAEIERNRRGDPLAMWPLLPDRTRARKPEGERLRYESRINGRSVTIPAEDVLHIPALGFDGYMGYSPIHIAREAVGLGLAAQRFGSKFFANDARAGGFLSHPAKLGDVGTKNVADSFNKQSGPDNAFKVKVLEEGMKFISTTIPPDDAQFLSTREFQVAEIARMYRVPLVLLNAMEKSTSWGTGIEQQMIAFVVWTIQPWIVRWEQELNRKLLTDAERASGVFIKFNLNAILRGDMKARGQFYKDLWGVSALNANEIRAFEDMDPYEGGSIYRAPLNTVDATEEPEDTEGADALDPDLTESVDPMSPDLTDAPQQES